MSKIYEYELHMKEMYEDADYQEWMAEQSEMSEQDINEMAMENMVDCKAKKFAQMMLDS